MVAIARPVAAAAAVAELVHTLLIIAAVLLGLAFVALVGFVAYRLRHRRNLPGAARAIPPARAAQPLPEPRTALGQAPEVHVHHHWHGVDAEDVAAILRGDGDIVRPSIKEE